jgi:nucleoside-diphosphate-sugar epimerase
LPVSEANNPKNSYRVFVTGAAGMVGFHLVRHLVELGHDVVAMVRPNSTNESVYEYARTHSYQVQVVECDLLEPQGLDALMKGCDIVVHAVAWIDPHGREQALRRINVDGTRSTIHAAIAAGAKQFVHISSLSVIMGDKDCYGVTEAEPLRVCREAYANSKIEAEKIVMHFDIQRQIKITTLRPGFIYGPNEKTWMKRLIFNMRKGTAMLVGDGSKETNLIYVENLCRAIGLALMNPIAFGQIYNLTDGERVTKRQLFDAICTGIGIGKVRLSVSITMARFLVDTATAIASVAPGPLKARLEVFSRPALRLAGLNQGFNISKAEQQLGYTDRIPFAEGMAKSLTCFAVETEKLKVKQRLLTRSN